MKNHFTVAVFDGDGIGPEIMQPCCNLVSKACDYANQSALSSPELTIEFKPVQAGAKCYQATGDALPEASIDTARQSDAILLSAMGDPAIRYPDGTEITPQIDLRFELGLYAGLRPVKSIPGVPSPLADPRAKHIDFVLIRESIEGLFAPQGPSKRIANERAEETLVITREISEKLFDVTFKLAQKRSATRVTCIDKANVFPAFAFFREIYYEKAQQHRQLLETHCSVDHAYVDIMSLNLLTQPWNYNVMVTENMFGDILSDLAAGLVGGMGYAPSADIGDHHAVFQPCHGSAPDIAGKGMANPTAMFLSAAMMLDWLADQHNNERARVAAALIVNAVNEAFATGNLKTIELGGTSSLACVVDAVNQAMTQACSS